MALNHLLGLSVMTIGILAILHLSKQKSPKKRNQWSFNPTAVFILQGSSSQIVGDLSHLLSSPMKGD